MKKSYQGSIHYGKQYLMGNADIAMTLNVYTRLKYDNVQKEVNTKICRQNMETVYAEWNPEGSFGQ